MRRWTTRRAAGAILLGSVLLWGGTAAAADTPGGGSAIPAGEIPDVLRARSGKPVTLQLRSGKEYGGTVAEVRADSVVLRTLTGKEFFDAIVRLDDVSAVELRRDP
jgi:hypothetical protein